MTTLARHTIVGAVLVLAMAGVPGVGHAEPTPTAPAKAMPASKATNIPKLDAEALRIPDSIHDTQAKKIEKPQKTLPPPSLPNKFDLGAYDLEFKASHSKDVVPRTGYDSGEKSNLSNAAFGRKSDPALPNYFGLKLSAPTN